MSGLASILWTAAAILAAILAARFWSPPGLFGRLSAALNGVWAPIVAGVVTSLIVAFVWGSFRQVPLLHDGIAYLTQARIFSTFHLYGGPRPLPEFFEQYHMFVTPKFMAKYPPGQSLSLVPGVWIGLPSLMPILLAGVTGALVFALARHISNAWVALLTWMLWSTAPGVLNFLPSYLSQTTTSALWLVGWWGLLRWRDDNRRRYLLLLAACIALGILTHPFTWLLYALPAGVAVLTIVVRRRTWKDLALASMIGCIGLGLLFGWSAETMGTGLRMPWSVYADTYFPWDRLGFSDDSTSPKRELPSDMVSFAASQRVFRAGHTVDTLPSQLASRLIAIFGDEWGDWRRILAPFALISLIAIGSELRLALVSVGVVILGFLLYGYDPQWTAYYVELYPVLAFATALGLWRFMCPVHQPKMTLREIGTCTFSHHADIAMLVLAGALLPVCASSIWMNRRAPTLSENPIVTFTKAAAALPGKRIIIFVRYAPTHPVNWSLVTNDADLEDARAWRVHDRGANDICLMRLAPARVPYLFDEATNTFALLDSSSVAAQRVAAATAVSRTSHANGTPVSQQHCCAPVACLSQASSS